MAPSKIHSYFSKAATMQQSSENTMNKTTRKTRRSRETLASPTLPSSLGMLVLLVLLSTPSLAFTGIEQKPTAIPLRRSTTMFYTSSDVENENASRNREGIPTSTSTRLQFRDGDYEDTIVRRKQHDKAAASWWKGIFAPAPVVDDETVDKKQAVVDDYLEFLDRRYHRLHDDQEASERKEVKFSAFKWLMQGAEEDGSHVMATKAQKEEDALYVLGVAGLASQRLLQKHHQLSTLPTASLLGSKARPMIQAIGATDAVVIPSTKLSVVTAMALASVAPVFNRLSLHRKALLRFETVKVQAVMRLLMRAATRVPDKASKALQALLQVGGGKQNVVATLTCTAALAFLVLRPVVQAVISERSV